MASVTISGPGTPTVNVPFNSVANNALAQDALNLVSAAATSGALGTYAPTVGGAFPGDTVPGPTGTASVTGLVDTVTGFFNLAGSHNAEIVVTGNATAYINSDTIPATIVAGANSSLVLHNNSPDAQIFLGGGVNAITQDYPSVSAVINVDGDPTAVGGVVVDAQLGFTTINMFAYANASVEAGGQILVNAEPGLEQLALWGSSTVPVTVTGTAGSTLYLLNDANAFIEPAAGNLLILPGSFGNTTLFGGSVTIGGQAYTAPVFSGSATVFGGTGYLQGGTAGNNILVSSTLSSAATLVGGNSRTLPGTNTDLLDLYGANDLAKAGSGSAVLAAFASGDTLVGGTGVDLLIDAASVGGNTIGFGLGNSTAYGHWSSTTTDNVFYQAAGSSVGTIASDTIADFKVGTDKFSLSLSSGSVSLSGITYSGTTSTAKLTDGTMISFVNAHVTSSDFI